MVTVRAAAAAIVLLSATSAHAQTESAPALTPDQLLPASVVRSGHHRVLDDVRVEGYLAEVDIESDFGTYRTRGLPMILLRVHEVETLAQAVTHFERENQRLAAELRGQLRVGADSFVDILASPLRTTAKLVDQATSNVNQTLREINTLGANSPAGAAGAGLRYESLMPDDPILAGHKRNAARQLGLDVYSSNPRVQDFLDAVATARSSGQAGAGAITVALPQRAERAVAGGRVQATIEAAVAQRPPGELLREVQAVLEATGVEPALAAEFARAPTLSPRHKAAIALHLRELDGARNPGAVVETALAARSEIEALTAVALTRMLARYHEAVSPVVELVSSGHLPVAVSRDGALVVALGFDVLYWDASSARVFDAIARHASDRGYPRREVLVLGAVTQQAREQLAALGFGVEAGQLLDR